MVTSFSVVNYHPLSNEDGDGGSTTNFLPYNEGEEDEKKNVLALSCSSGDCNETTATSTSSTSISELDYITVALPNVFYNCNNETKECNYKVERTAREVGVLMKDSAIKGIYVNTTNKAIECCGGSSKENVIEKTVNSPAIKCNRKNNNLVIQHLPSLNIRSELVTQSLPTVEIKCTESTVQTCSPLRNICYEVIQHTSVITTQEKDFKEPSEKIKAETSSNIATTSNPKADTNLGVETVIETLTSDPTVGSILKSYEVLPVKNIDNDTMETNSTIRNKIDVDVYQTYISNTRRRKRSVSIKEMISQKEQNIDNVDLTEIKAELEDFLKEIEESHSVPSIYLEPKENDYVEENDMDKVPRKIISDHVIGNLKQLSEISTTQFHEQTETASSEVSEQPINLKLYPNIFPDNYILYCDKSTEISIKQENNDTMSEDATHQYLNDCTALVKNQTKELPLKCEKQTEEIVLKGTNSSEFKSNVTKIVEENFRINKSKITCKGSHQQILKLCVCGTEDGSKACDKKYILVVDSKNLKDGDVLGACVDQSTYTHDVACYNFNTPTSCESKQVQTNLPINLDNNNDINYEESESTHQEISKNDIAQETVMLEKSIQEKHSSSVCTVKINDEKQTKCTKTIQTKVVLGDLELKKAEPTLTAEAESQAGVSLNSCTVDITVPSGLNACEASFQTCTEQLISFSNSECKSHLLQLHNKIDKNKSTAVTKCISQNVSNFECKSKSAQIPIIKNTFYCECSEEKELINIDLQDKSINQPFNECNAKTEDIIKRNIGIQTTKISKRAAMKCPKGTSEVECFSTLLETDSTDISTNGEECLSCENISLEKGKKPLLISQNIQVNITKTANKMDRNESSKLTKEIPKETNKQIYKESTSNSYFEEKRSVKIQTSLKTNSINCKKKLFDKRRSNNKVYNYDFCTCKSKQRCNRQIGIQKGPGCNWARNRRTRELSFDEDNADTCSESISGLSSDCMSEGEVRQNVSIGELYPCEFNCTSFYKKNPEKLLKQQTGDKNVCLLRERTIYDNWKSYYFSHQSRPSK
ncbi:uncharacterized protein LOC108742727 isoform X2 [Agrilus planipennis]|nr:uncharacterized protein LOC108742727 isoform X2 [Agrilus planipennis]